MFSFYIPISCWSKSVECGIDPLNIVLKLHVIIFFRNESFLCFERRLAAVYMQSSLFFLLRVWGTQITKLLTFPNFFKWWQIVDKDLSSADSLKVTSLKSDSRPDLGSSPNEI